MTESSKVVTIYTESNPNPNSLKFVANFMLMPEGISRDYPTVADTESAPLAKALFEKFSWVNRVFYMSNFVTVTKDDKTEWFEVKTAVQDFIRTFLEAENPILTEKIEKTLDEELTGSDTETKIKGVLEEYIRPAVEMDGGAISFHSFEEGTVKVLLQGSCSGCPSSTITLKSGIENLLKRMVPEVQEVVAEDA
ncbi:MAG: NifU family protein [Cyclobacteriaceae bacterium]